jgi:hypothetical protein
MTRGLVLGPVARTAPGLLPGAFEPGPGSLASVLTVLAIFALGVAVGLLLSAIHRSFRRGPGRIGFHIGPVSKREE